MKQTIIYPAQRVMERSLGYLSKFNRMRTTDAFFIAHPKTGNTWTRFMLGRYVQLICSMEEMPFFHKYDRWGRCERGCVGPSIHFTHAPLLFHEDMRVHQTANDLTFNLVVKPYQKKKVVLIVRYPLDALVSRWFHSIHVIKDYDGDLQSFLEHPVYNLDKIIRFYNIWAEGRQTVSNLMLLRYEDLRKDTHAHFKALLTFLGFEVNEELMHQAIEYASFENMRKMEETNTVPYSGGVRGFPTGDIANPETYRVRKGKVKGYKEYLSEDVAAQYEARICNELDPWYGYRSF